MNHELYMRRCMTLAQNHAGYVAPNPMVGAVLVAPDGQIVAEGAHEYYGGNHAEVNCFLDAERKGITDFSSYTLYCSLEPCSHYGKQPPCALKIVEKDVRCVVVGAMDPNPKVAGRGVAILREAGIEVLTGVLEDECRWQNRRFMCLHENHRPYVILKWAQTADGFLDKLRDSADEPVLTISSELTKQIVHRMRAENMAILVGARTALLDNPGLRTTRWPGRSPIRVLLDRHHTVSPLAKIFRSAAQPNQPAYPGDEVIVFRERTDWPYVLSELAERGIHSVLVEGGGQVLRHIIETGIYDEVHVEVGPMKIGVGVPAPALALPAEPSRCVDNRLLYEWMHIVK